MFKTHNCKNQLTAMLECCHHEQQVEIDKMRRDINLHNEWWWLNIYDEDGEIGKQAEWEPETKVTKIWGSMLWNMMYKQDQQGGMNAEQRADRLHELRNS